MPDTVTQSLRDVGYNATSGTFGREYAPNGKGLERLRLRFELAGFAEAGIVVVDLTAPSADTAPIEEAVTEFDRYWWKQSALPRVDLAGFML